MQADQSTVMKAVIWTGISLLVALIIVSMVVVGSINSNLKLVGDKFDNFDVDENALANAILAKITLPEYDTSKIDALWEGVYSDEIDDLEKDSFIESVYQFYDDNNYLIHSGIEWDASDNDDIINAINAEFETLEDLEESGFPISFEENDDLFDFLVDEYEDEYDGVWDVEFIREYKDKREFNVINLGLDDEDDREVELSSVIRVRVFTDEDDEDESELVRVYIDSTVTSDDGDLEAEVTYSL